MYRLTQILPCILLPALVVASIASLFVHPGIADFWLNTDYWPVLFIFTFLSILAFFSLFLSIKKRVDFVP
jgi:hypothetical protein